MKRILGLVMILILAGFSTQAATVFVIEGVILDENAVPLIGANILIEGTDKGVVSDLNGGFTINSSAACLDLRVSFIGFETLITEACTGRHNKNILTNGITIEGVVIKAYAPIKLDQNRCYTGARIRTTTCYGYSFKDTTEVVNQFQEELKAPLRINCHPIPANEYISINLENDIDKLEIFDIQGQLLITKSAMAQGVSTVYIDNLPPGTYVFKFTKGTEVQTVRVSKI